MSSEQLLNDEALRHFERQRMKLIANLTKGDTLPEDPKVQKVLLSAIDGGSKVVIAMKRLEQDKAANSVNQSLQATMAEILKNTVTNDQKVLAQRREEAQVPEVVPKPGETQTGTLEVKYSTMVGETQ
jgi:hypothetical protein